jgi:tryptophan halogenase
MFFSDKPISDILVLGGGSAGFMAALALKIKVPGVRVTVLRSPSIGIIGVGEGSTAGVKTFLHTYLGIGMRKFFKSARPTWKLGLHFIWGPRPAFDYPFGKLPEAKLPGLSKAVGYYLGEDMTSWDTYSALMEQGKFCHRGPDGMPKLFDSVAYHFENEPFVRSLEEFAAAQGIVILDQMVKEVQRSADGAVAGLVLQSGQTLIADLYVDCSGFGSLLLGKTLGEPFQDYNASLFCDRAVIGGWARGDEPIKPYTTCETMESGWTWQIEHESRINRGYVYSSGFISDEAADREFREKNPKVEQTRVVKFLSGRYHRCWVHNVVAIGNAAGFVEPLEATALGVIAMHSWLLADTLRETGRRPGPAAARQFNQIHANTWDGIRDFLAVHYRFNTRLDTPFWRHCQEKTELAGAQEIVELYREGGPAPMWADSLLHKYDINQLGGYYAILLGQRVPHGAQHDPTDSERQTWARYRKQFSDAARTGLTVRQALDAVNSPSWTWPDQKER